MSLHPSVLSLQDVARVCKILPRSFFFSSKMTIVVCFLLDTRPVSISPEDEDDEIVLPAPKGGWTADPCWTFGK
jgi:hypothetical protein